MSKLQNLHYIINAHLGFFKYLMMPKKKDIWIIGGHAGKLYTDNAKVFYEYILEHHPSIEIYWMLNQDAKIKNKIPGKTLTKGSIAAYAYVYHAKYILFSDTYNSDIAPFGFVLPIARYFYTRQTKVYLSHGTISFKKMPQFSGIKQKIKSKIFSSYDVAVASTPLEVKVMHEYGVKKENIHLLGSARHDTLINKTTSEKIILIAPTWRPWLYHTNNIKKSTFYKNYVDVLSDTKLLQLSEKYNLKIYFYLHHMFHDYLVYFKPYEKKNLKILEPSTNISHIIQTAKMLITDYSSISSDFYYLKKPILFYQFDQEKYLKTLGSEIDLVHDTFGEVTKDNDKLVKHILYTIKNDFNISKKQKIGEKFFLYYKDKKNCERIYTQVTLKK